MCLFALQSLYDDGAETTRRQLLASSLSLQIASDDCVEQLLDVWRGVVGRVYHYYQLSAKAYFTYLKLNAQVGEVMPDVVVSMKLHCPCARPMYMYKYRLTRADG